MPRNTVNFLCPKCQSLLPIDRDLPTGGETKHSAFSVPVEIANEIVGTEVTCNECFESFIVQPHQSKYVVLRLVEAPEF